MSDFRGTQPILAQVRVRIAALVVDENWLDDPVTDRFVTLDRLVASKVFYTHRF